MSPPELQQLTEGERDALAAMLAPRGRLKQFAAVSGIHHDSIIRARAGKHVSANAISSIRATLASPPQFTSTPIKEDTMYDRAAGPKRAWANMSPEERKAEMKRRVAKGKRKKAAATTKTALPELPGNISVASGDTDRLQWYMEGIRAGWIKIADALRIEEEATAK